MHFSEPKDRSLTESGIKEMSIESYINRAFEATSREGDVRLVILRGCTVIICTKARFYTYTYGEIVSVGLSI